MLEDLPVFLGAISTDLEMQLLAPVRNFRPSNEFLIKFFPERYQEIHQTVQVESLIMAAKTSGQGTPFAHNVVHPLDMKLVKEWFYRNGCYPEYNDNTDKKNIYLSRIGYRRTPKGEEILVRKLKDKGFYIFDGKMSLLDQISLFSNAKLVVGTNGSAFVNLVWMKPGSSVLNTHYSGEKFHFVFNLAMENKLNYLSVDMNSDNLSESNMDLILNTVDSIIFNRKKS